MITFIDVESTGINANFSEILTFYGVTDDDEGKTVSSLYVELKPEHWGAEAEKASKVHGINFEDAMLFDDKKEGLLKIYKYLSRNAKKVICHANYNNYYDKVWLGNYYYDWALLKSEAFRSDYYYNFLKAFHKTKVISTHTIAKRLLNLQKYDLRSLCKRFEIELDHHNVMSDTIATRELYYKLINYRKLI